MAHLDICAIACALSAAALMATAAPTARARGVQQAAFEWAATTRPAVVERGAPDWAATLQDSVNMVRAVHGALWESALPPRVLHCVEVFAGSGKVAEAVSKRHFAALAYEKDLDDRMDCRSLTGFLVLAFLMASVVKHGCVHFSPECFGFGSRHRDVAGTVVSSDARGTYIT